MNTNEIKAFSTQKQCVFTLVSTNTGDYYTYAISKGKMLEENARFIKTAQSDVGNSISIEDDVGSVRKKSGKYIGMMFLQKIERNKPNIVRTKGSTANTNKSWTVLEWFLSALYSDEGLGDKATFLHAGACARCGRELTTPQSLERGFGSTCWDKVK